MFTLLMLLTVIVISVHVASYGWYALRKEKKLRGAVGAFVVAGATIAAPVLLMLYYAVAS